MFRHPLWISVFLCLLGFNVVAQEPPPALVGVDAVRQQALTQTAPVIARLVAREEGPVAALVNGAVQSVGVLVGDRVRAGAVLAQLARKRQSREVVRRQAEERLEKARLQTTRARMKLARQEARRFGELKGSPAFPKANYEDKLEEVARYESEIEEAKASIARASAELGIATIDLERTKIRAPYNGVITRRYVSPGAFLSLGDAVVSMVNDADLEIEADVPASQLAGLRGKVAVAIELEDGSLHSARVRAIVPNENPLTRTRQVRFRPLFNDTGRSLAVNQSVIVKLPVAAARELLSVHKDAVINRGDKYFAFVVTEGIVEQRKLRLGVSSGNRLEVLSGLQAGELAVTRGNERLRPGQKVRH